MTNFDKAEWLADKICNGGDYAKEAAFFLKQQSVEIAGLRTAIRAVVRESHPATQGICSLHIFDKDTDENILPPSLRYGAFNDTNA